MIKFNTEASGHCFLWQKLKAAQNNLWRQIQIFWTRGPSCQVDLHDIYFPQFLHHMALVAMSLQPPFPADFQYLDCSFILVKSQMELWDLYRW